MLLRLGCRGTVDVDVAIDEVSVVQSEILLGEIPSACDVTLAVDDHDLLVHSMKEPARMPERQGVIDADLDTFIAQMGEHGAWDVLKIRVDDQPHVADAAPLRIAQQRQRRDRDPVVVREKVDRGDLLLRLLDDVDARLRGFAVIVENTKNVSVRRRGDGDYEENRGSSHDSAICMR